MAGEEAVEGSGRRRRMDLNLYVGLPPLPQPRIWLDTSAASSTLTPNSTGAAPEAPRTGEPEESLALAVVGEPEKDGSCGCSSSFECNICLDVAKEPVVTPCGHLFCWPCLYRWLHAKSPFPECPVCKGEVLKGNITPIYGRGSEEGDSTANPDLPPRPRANRRESLRQQLQMARDTGEIASVMRQLIQNQGTVGGLPTLAGTEMTSVPAARAGARRQQRQDNSASRSIQSVVLNVGNVASESSNPIQLPHSNGDNAAQVVLAAPQQSSSVEQLSTSSTTAAIVGEPGSSRRSRPSESPTIRRTRRRPQ